MHTTVKGKHKAAQPAVVDPLKVSRIPVQRSKTGCQQCRRRKRKCDERRPSCTGCVERGLPCQWIREPPSRPRIPPRHSPYNRDFAVPHEMRSLMTVFTIPTSSVKERLLAHFQAYSPLWLTIGGDVRRSTLLSLVMPAVERSPLVFDCVMALSAGDLSKYESTSSDLINLANSFYGQALAGVRSALDREFLSSNSAKSLDYTEDDTLLAVLLLCVHEAVNFTATYRILPHINAAAAICHNRSRSTAANSRLRGLLFEFFCYFFALIAFSHGHALQLHLGPSIFASPFLEANDDQGILLGGRCLMVLSCILKVATLTSARNGNATVAENSHAPALRAIEMQLSDWSGVPLPDDDRTTLLPDDAIAEIYRLACLIHVKRLLGRDSNGFSDIQRLLSQFISLLNRLPTTSPANGILCWPLVVAGMSSVDATHRRLIVGRLRTVHETWRSKILTGSAALLESIWKEDKYSRHSQESRDIHPTHVKGTVDFHSGHTRASYPIVLL
ncbi:hypothetical protein PFICI_14342 [Pestalotiopsis fici W106-1]|uniref:Zn(2)-C6 fungal-type domain-containing protein n=1 Tax=Pestalotiopsis fici (strain W106-1 / CGMCC3.15140) TaxID=1229662 RepID=W3WNS5_PESFW|nr:uncharacterized protein PFICI_14342 [Pestalotiopsis fici W106-1]ETS74476.1 hypothetical protein PFICI_14342 [Pestalotiopsis fici W106-1]